MTVREEGSGFLAGWAKRLSWSVVAEAFQTSWDRVFRSVDMAVTWGLEHRDLEGVEAIWVDEVLWHKGYKFLTVVYQIDQRARRLLWVGQNRRAKTLLKFFRAFGRERCARISMPVPCASPFASLRWTRHGTLSTVAAENSTHPGDAMKVEIRYCSA